MQDLPTGLEKLEELVRRYKRSKSSGKTTTALDDDIKTAALEALVPGALEQHLAMNRARLTHRRSPQIRLRWTALAREARKARRAIKEKVME